MNILTLYPCPSEQRFILDGTENREIPEDSACVVLKGSASESPLPSLPEKVQKLFIHHPSSEPSHFAFPTGLTSLRRLSLHGIHFKPDSRRLDIPTNVPIKFLELINCHSFRLNNAKIQILRLKDCTKVLLGSGTHPTYALDTDNVEFMSPGFSFLPQSIKVLRLKNTHGMGGKGVGTVVLPPSLEVFISKDFKCSTVKKKNKKYIPLLRVKEKLNITWFRKDEGPQLWTLIEQLPTTIEDFPQNTRYQDWLAGKSKN